MTTEEYIFTRQKVVGKEGNGSEGMLGSIHATVLRAIAKRQKDKNKIDWLRSTTRQTEDDGGSITVKSVPKPDQSQFTITASIKIDEDKEQFILSLAALAHKSDGSKDTLWPDHPELGEYRQSVKDMSIWFIQYHFEECLNACYERLEAR
jgi:hypothetical protein